MKIYLNREPVKGPWGGGNKVVSKLYYFLKNLGYEICFTLEDNIDVIFCFDPRPNNKGEWYQHFLNYKGLNTTKIIQRIGDVGTHNKPDLTELVKQTVHFSDYLIFTSKWAKDYIHYNGTNCDIIINGPLKIFHKNKRNNVNLNEEINIVTHHWSNNNKKGFDFYEKIDSYIENKNINFTYIGRKPDNFKIKNLNYIEPKNADILSELLPTYDIYITASLEEAGANHVLEAMAAGLPVLYRKNGGSIEEYCCNYGLQYDTFDDFINQLNEMIHSYRSYKENILQYDHTIDNVIEDYYKIICKI